MRDAARALDDVSDHLGEVLRHADELLAEWGRFGAQVRTQVEREACAIGAVVDGAVERAASAGIDRAIAERLRLLSAEIERIEQRARAASRAVTEQREEDRRVLWIVVAGVVLANALLVVLLLRKPEPVRALEPIRIEAVAPPPIAEPVQAHAVPAGGSGDSGATEPASALEVGVPGANASSSSGSGAAARNGSNAGGAKPGAKVPADAAQTGVPSSAAAKPGAVAGANSGAPAGTNSGTPGSVSSGAPAGPNSRAPTSNRAGSAKPGASPVVLPQKTGAVRTHKKLP